MLLGLKEKNEFNFIQSLVIESMSKASYDVKNIGHYGLIFRLYSFHLSNKKICRFSCSSLLEEKLTVKNPDLSTDLIEGFQAYF